MKRERGERNERRCAVQPCSSVLPHRLTMLIGKLSWKQITGVLPFHNPTTVGWKLASPKVQLGKMATKIKRDARYNLEIYVRL